MESTKGWRIMEKKDKVKGKNGVYKVDEDTEHIIEEI